MGLETWVLGAFLAALAVCIGTGTELLYALLFGMLCFSWYTVKKGRTPGNVLRLLPVRHGAGGEYHNHFCADWLPDSQLAGRRHNPFYPVLLCGSD